MLQKTKGIVLHTLKYNDTSIIVDMYTELSGRTSFLDRSLHFFLEFHATVRGSQQSSQCFSSPCLLSSLRRTTVRMPHSTG